MYEVLTGVIEHLLDGNAAGFGFLPAFGTKFAFKFATTVFAYNSGGHKKEVVFAGNIQVFAMLLQSAGSVLRGFSDAAQSEYLRFLKPVVHLERFSN